MSPLSNLQRNFSVGVRYVVDVIDRNLTQGSPINLKNNLEGLLRRILLGFAGETELSLLLGTNGLTLMHPDKHVPRHIVKAGGIGASNSGVGG